MIAVLDGLDVEPLLLALGWPVHGWPLSGPVCSTTGRR